MLSIRFSSTYKETDCDGNSRMWHNEFEARGDALEVISAVELFRDCLPGTKPLLLPGYTSNFFESKPSNPTLGKYDPLKYLKLLEV